MTVEQQPIVQRVLDGRRSKSLVRTDDTNNKLECNCEKGEKTCLTTDTVSREAADDGMKNTPKFIEIRDENVTGSILHPCEPGANCNIIKAWMKRQPENCERSATAKGINDVKNNVDG